MTVREWFRILRKSMWEHPSYPAAKIDRVAAVLVDRNTVPARYLVEIGSRTPVREHTERALEVVEWLNRAGELPKLVETTLNEIGYHNPETILQRKAHRKMAEWVAGEMERQITEQTGE